MFKNVEACLNLKFSSELVARHSCLRDQTAIKERYNKSINELDNTYGDLEGFFGNAFKYKNKMVSILLVDLLFYPSASQEDIMKAFNESIDGINDGYLKSRREEFKKLGGYGLTSENIDSLLSVAGINVARYTNLAELIEISLNELFSSVIVNKSDQYKAELTRYLLTNGLWSVEAALDGESCTLVWNIIETLSTINATNENGFATARYGANSLQSVADYNSDIISEFLAILEVNLYLAFKKTKQELKLRIIEIARKDLNELTTTLKEKINKNKIELESCLKDCESLECQIFDADVSDSRGVIGAKINDVENELSIAFMEKYSLMDLDRDIMLAPINSLVQKFFPPF